MLLKTGIKSGLNWTTGPNQPKSSIIFYKKSSLYDFIKWTLHIRRDRLAYYVAAALSVEPLQGKATMTTEKESFIVHPICSMYVHKCMCYVVVLLPILNVVQF